MKNLVILGVTGSIGNSTLKVVQAYPERFRILGASCRSKIEALTKIASSFKIPYLVVEDFSSAEKLKKSLDYKAEVLVGEEGLKTLVQLDEAHIIVIGISGIKALLPTYYALKAGKRVAIANKESLIVAGEILKEVAKEAKAELLPVDSEHSSIFQLLQKEKKEQVKRIILTASGGPFYRLPLEEFVKITPEMAVKHPNWKMGAKISVDSATLMNKGFEVLEAKVLFDFPLEKIEVLIHPQSLVHGLVELIDGSILMHLSFPDMQLPISYALNYPERIELQVPKVQLEKIGSLVFEAPDLEKFPCLKLAYEAGQKGGVYPLILEAADEVVVEAFLQKRITFDKIPYFLAKTLDGFKIPERPSGGEDLSFLLTLHKEVCLYTEKLIKGNKTC
ncbi:MULTISPECIES: 1-deoxy-D-xylulose-5-phosphate reductoisomerase [Thermodesulfobacterium]|jgi:1-deoxy-D-xylulose-5-phosphate reductoisomerase|uniref:1-deoxy-D-xylulose 5-phosphate reductoisomerase n=1 Tax=Thermodesulfobacterium commune TaxID=1741 RepID=A0A101FK51_9BACT|nr:MULTISPECIES: 1-deoxy-D-xylulose-5-phosphate reductoisomerase [Thermodesulfobacterium]KUJ97202.1 MAG: 1-deoxy-D-xylulose 5-phosphate reductoisomerase [Thermodesulfobacterium sp. 37_54]KUK18850.1 MAG: 1-deoxy-D-xylulose 5-phosphate reductoisomerase [Thermodesulfobacterium commune]KUK38503.1 MAG: 1-deoxy-D-xylulose 5-phosphate reductoisomerase [Thermodesulfobacterium commune]MBZ4682378.1 1-deoxy-D-xylulose-5-phosphate reductoisomerase [Thermodesulfobacterium sp.]MDK2861683.1 1-deoxy-D-xylulos